MFPAQPLFLIAELQLFDESRIGLMRQSRPGVLQVITGGCVLRGENFLKDVMLWFVSLGNLEF